MELTKYWIGLTQLPITYAINGKSRSDYNLMCESQPVDKTQNYQDRIKILDYLLGENVIGERENKLFLIDSELSFLDSQLEEGCQASWEIVEENIPQKTKQRKFDDSLNKKIGDQGEKFVYQELVNALDDEKLNQLKHVSLEDDTLGYDILSPVNASTKKLCLEVKTTVIPSDPFRFYLSRNEYNVSQIKDDCWFIILVRIVNGEPRIVGSIESKHLPKIVPVDSIKKISRWENVSINVQPEWVKPGLPIE